MSLLLPVCLSRYFHILGEKTKSLVATTLLPYSLSPYSAEFGLQVVRGRGESCVYPIRNFRNETYRWKIGRKTHWDTHTHTHTHTLRGPTWHARGGLRWWINLEVAGWVSTAGAAAPAYRWTLATPGDWKDLHTNVEKFTSVRTSVCVCVFVCVCECKYMFGFTGDWVYPCVCIDLGYFLQCQVNGRGWGCVWSWWGTSMWDVFACQVAF